MNLVMTSVLLLAALLACRPTLIYGWKRSASGGASGSGKRHSTLSAVKPRASLIMQLESGDVFVRKARGAGGDFAPTTAALLTNGDGDIAVDSSSSSSNSAIAFNASSAPQSQPAAPKKHLEKKFSAAAANLQHAVEHGNNKGKQRQMLKSQQSPNHGKRAGTKSAPTNAEKTVSSEKPQATCRYAKSAWTECDAKTNSRSRTLTLKKGENNCKPTRTVDKKCKKVCRYEKGSWTECSNGVMTRQDKLKVMSNVDSSNCDPLRSANRKCNPEGARGTKSANRERKNREKAGRRAQQQA